MPNCNTARARRWTVTFNKDKPDMKALEDKDEIRYMIIGEEKAPTTGHIHYQGYVEFNKALRLAGVKRLLEVDVHCLVSKGTAEQNIVYCSKEGKVEEFGVPAKKTQGQRTDIEAVYEHFKEGKTEAQALDEGSHLGAIARYPKFINKLEMHFTPDRTEQTELYIYWGPTHTGKSHTAYEEAKQLGSVYYKPLDKNTAWWDGYHQHDYVIIEDFRGEIALSVMLRLCDKYPMSVQFKGGYKKFNSKRIYITSNIDVDEWFNQDQKGYDASIAAFKRRITVKKHFNDYFQLPAN